MPHTPAQIAVDNAHKRMQVISDMLLLTADLRPINVEALNNIRESVPKCRDVVLDRSKRVSSIIYEVMTQLQSVTAKWQDIGALVDELCEVVILLTECCAHLAYLVATNHQGCTKASGSIVDKFKTNKSCFEIQHCCNQFKNINLEAFNADRLVNLSSTISTHLSILTETCKSASNIVDEANNREQFKLCIKTLTASASSLIQCVKTMKVSPSETHHRRCIAFANSLSACCAAVANFATEPQFTGKPAHLTASATDAHTALRSACLSVSSTSIYWCKLFRDFTFDTQNPTTQSKLQECVKSLDKASLQLLQSVAMVTSPQT